MQRRPIVFAGLASLLTGAGAAAAQALPATAGGDTPAVSAPRFTVSLDLLQGEVAKRHPVRCARWPGW